VTLKQCFNGTDESNETSQQITFRATSQMQITFKLLDDIPQKCSTHEGEYEKTVPSIATWQFQRKI